MRIEIKKKGNKTAILVSFDMNAERMNTTEKSRFFTELYGRNQTIKGEKKKYFYRRAGLMDEMPHIKVDNSVFIVAMEQMRMMEEFMNEWERKVMFKTFPVILNEEEAEQLEEKAEEEQPEEKQGGFKLLKVSKKEVNKIR